MKPRPVLLALLILVSTLLLLVGSERHASMTVDEAHYIGVGRRLLEKGDWEMKGALLHPPLPYYMNSVFLYGVPVSDTVWAAPNQDDRGRALVRALPGNRMLFLSRLPTILLTLALLLLVFLETRRAFGGAAALFALLLAAFEPNLLAHGSLATPDLPITALVFLAVLRFRRLRERADARNLLLAGVALGLALLSKYSALLLLGVLPVTALADRAGRRLFVRFPLVLLVAFLVVHAAYLPRLLHGGGASPFGKRLLPPPYEEGMEYQARANEGHHAFFMGQISKEGWRAYYPVAFLVKTPLPFLLLAAAGAGLLIRRRRRSDAAWLLLPPVLFFSFFVLASRINIGVRYVLPVYPFLAVAGGFAAAAAWGAGGRLRAGVFLLIAWHAVGAGIAYPHFLAFFNEAVGGPEGGARILADSNIDWGQDLPGLKDFLDKRGAQGVYLAYFGNDDPERYGIVNRFLPGWVYSPPPRVYDESLRIHPKPELVAVSRMLMQGVWLPDPKLYAWLEEFPRVGTIGHSILVYDIGGDPGAHEKLAGVYRRAGHLQLFRDELVLQFQAERRRK